MAAIGKPKFDTGPQKWVVNKYLNVCLLKNDSLNFLKDIVRTIVDHDRENLGVRGREGVRGRAGMRSGRVELVREVGVGP